MVTQGPKFSAASVTTDPDRSAHSFLLTGRPGIGKTYFLTTVDRIFIIPVEEGLKGGSPNHHPARFTAVPRTLKEFHDALDAFAREVNAPGPDRKRPYPHLGVDSLSGIEALVHEAACAQEGAAHIESKEYGKVYAAALQLFSRVMRHLDTIRRMGTHVWIIAHSQEVQEANDSGDLFKRWDLAFRGADKRAQEARNLWRQWADHVLFLDWDSGVVAKKGKRTMGQLRARILRCRESGYAFAKTRARIPDTLPATWPDLQKAIASGMPAPEARLRSQVQDLIARLSDENAALIRADLDACKNANALAAALSRAQGMLAVERAAEPEAEPPPEPVAAEQASHEFEDERDPAPFAARSPASVATPAPASPPPESPGDAVPDPPEAQAAAREPGYDDVDDAEAPGESLDAEPAPAETNDRALYEALSADLRSKIAQAANVASVDELVASTSKDLKASCPDLWDDIRAAGFQRKFTLATDAGTLQALTRDITAAKLSVNVDATLKTAYAIRMRQLKGAGAAR